jgi:hypothetical protein
METHGPESHGSGISGQARYRPARMPGRIRAGWLSLPPTGHGTKLPRIGAFSLRNMLRSGQTVGLRRHAVAGMAGSMRSDVGPPLVGGPIPMGTVARRQAPRHARGLEPVEMAPALHTIWRCRHHSQCVVQLREAGPRQAGVNVPEFRAGGGQRPGLQVE